MSFGPRFSSCSWVPPTKKESLSAVRSSVPPSDLIKVYLSSSKGKNVSFVPATTGVESCPDVILTVKVFLMLKEASVRSTVAILFFGSLVYNVLSEDDDSFVVKILKSTALKLEVGRVPLATPVTLDTP